MESQALKTPTQTTSLFSTKIRSLKMISGNPRETLSITAV